MRWATLFCLIAILLISNAEARAQATGQITGTVTSTTGVALAGATVNVRGTDRSAVTDAAGRYTITAVPAGTHQVRVTRLGYGEQSGPVTVAAGETATADFQLTMQAVELEGVVAVGYGTQRKEELTSAVTAVEGEALAKRPARNIQSALQGHIPGVAVWDQGGEPGAARMFFRIRGTTTLGNNNPLVIVDGIEQNWADINPNEIETISVLKDAASTAIYGSRGANGIVLVTTRRGKAGDFKVSYNTYLDLQNLAVEPEHMDVESYLRLQNLAFENRRGGSAKYSEEVIQQYVSGEDRLRYPLPNTWFETVIRDNAPMQNHSLTISGGTAQLTSLAALNYFDQQGVYPNRDARRYQFRLNNDFRVNDRIKLSADLNIRRSERSRPNYGGNTYHWMIHGSQWTVPRYPDGTYGLSPQGRNPLAFSDPDYFGMEKQQTDYGVLNLQGNWEILRGLEFASQYGIEMDQQSGLENNPTYEIRDYWNRDVVLQQNNVNRLSERREEYLQRTWNSTLTYRTRLLDHGITLLGGYSEIAFDRDSLWVSGRGLYNNDVRALDQSDPEDRGTVSRYTDWGLRSFFGRAHYSFADRYLLEMNVRYDGSSRFPEGDRYTFFPSVSAGWRVSEEPFWEPLRGVVSEFKPRASWGRTGNQNVGLYTYFDRLDIGNYYVFNNTPAVGVRQNALTARGLTWETTTQTNVGLDASLFDGELNLTFDWFDKLTEGILLNLPVPGVLGLYPAATNAGSVKNTGWELQLGHRGATGDLGYGLSVNLADVRNEVVDLAGTGPYYSQSKNWLVIQEGSPIHSLWGYRTDGYYTQADFDNKYPKLSGDARVGDIKYLDVNGDGVLSPEDRTVLGSTLPRWTYGSALDLNWRNLDFNLQMQGVARQDMAVWGAFVENGSWEGFALAKGRDYWTPENPNARFPRPQKNSNKNSEPSDWWVESAAYLRLKNVQLGYTLPEGIGRRAGLGRMRVFAGGTNLFTISGLNDWGIDAETVTGRSDYYPALRSYTVGLNLDL
jgi:TonB-linked SusC/RagA family outer membrane protein